MSALAEALVAAQRRALAAVEKAVVAGTLAETDATETLNAIGCTDAVDQSRLFAALATIRELGASAPAETKPAANGVPEAKASAAQLARIRRDLEARNLPMLAEADQARLTKQRASEMIDALASPDYDPSAWDVPFCPTSASGFSRRFSSTATRRRQPPRRSRPFSRTGTSWRLSRTASLYGRSRASATGLTMCACDRDGLCPACAERDRQEPDPRAEPLDLDFRALFYGDEPASV